MINQIITFPQRIPRHGFLKELYELETDKYKNDFDFIIKKLLSNHKSSLQNLINNDTWECAREYLNWSYILMRYGYFEDILNNFPNNGISSFALEISLLRESAKTQLLLSDGMDMVIDNYLKLSEIFLTRKETTDREKILLLNQTIVNFYRHQNDKTISKQINQLSESLLALLPKNNNFINMLYTSAAYRGLAMDFEYGEEIQFSFLDKAEKLARSIHCKTAMEQIIAKDNLFTCVQSLSKWHLYQKNTLIAEEYLKELICIDHHDSTGFSELGFFYLNQDRIEQALSYFKQAMQLGPPGSGMNCYYYAKCLEKLGDERNTIKYLYEATKLDPYGISAWLDLLFYFTNMEQRDKATEIAYHIYGSLTLFEQLEDEEKATIQSYIN